MKRLLSSLIPIAALFLAGNPLIRAADVVDNAQITQLTPNGDWVAQQINFNSNSAGQDFVVTSTGRVGVNAVVKGNITSSVIAGGSAVSLTTATPKTVTSLVLGPGTWQIYGYVDLAEASATTSLQECGIATTTNSFTNSKQSQDTTTTSGFVTTTSSQTWQFGTPVLQVTLTASSTTFYLVAEDTFSAGTSGAYGTLFARQIK